MLGQRAPPCGQPAAISARPQLHTPLKLIILTLIISFTHSSFLFSLFFNTKTLYSLFTLFTLSSFNHTIPKKIRRRKKINKNTQSQQFSTLLFSLFSLPFSPLMRRRRFDFWARVFGIWGMFVWIWGCWWVSSRGVAWVVVMEGEVVVVFTLLLLCLLHPFSFISANMEGLLLFLFLASWSFFFQYVFFFFSQMGVFQLV